MLKLFKRFLNEEDGLGTVEIVIIIAVLVGIALIFRSAIIDFVKGILTRIFSDEKLKDAGNVDLGTINTD